MSAIEKFITEFYNNNQIYYIVSIKSYKEIIEKIDSYDMLFKLASKHTMAVFIEIPTSVLSIDEDIKNISGQNKNFVIVEDNIKCILGHMFSDTSGLKILTPCEYTHTDNKYFRKACSDLGIDADNKNKDKIIEHLKKIITKEELINDIVENYNCSHFSYCLRQKEKRLRNGNITEDELKTKKNLCYTAVKFWSNILRRRIPVDVKSFPSSDKEKSVMSSYYNSVNELRYKDLTEVIIKEFENAMVQYISHPKNYNSSVYFDVDYSPNDTFRLVGKLMESKEHWKIISCALPWKTGMAINNFEYISIEGTKIDILQAPDDFELIYNEKTEK